MPWSMCAGQRADLGFEIALGLWSSWEPAVKLLKALLSLLPVSCVASGMTVLEAQTQVIRLMCSSLVGFRYCCLVGF